MPRYVPHQRESPGPEYQNALPPMSDDEKIIHILDYMKQVNLGFWSLRSFISAVFTSNDDRVKSRIGKFFQYGGFKTTFGLMLRHQRFAPNRRVLQRSSKELIDTIGPEICELFIRILRYEMGVLSEDPQVRKAPGDITPEDCRNFSYQRYELLFKEKGPLLFKIIRTLCCVPEELSQNAIFDPEYAPEELAQEPEVEAAEDPEFGEAYEYEDEDEDENEDNIRSMFARSADFLGRKPGRNRGKRDKGLIATNVLGIMLFARSRWNNALATMFGLYLQSAKVPKRPLTVLNRLGLSISYSTVCKAMQSNAIADRDSLRMKVAAGTPWDVCWDNLVRTEKKEEETQINRQTIEQNTSAFVRMLYIPKPEETAPDWMKQAYEHIQRVIIMSVGLPKSLMQRPDPQFAALTPFQFIGLDTMQVHFPVIAAMHIGDILSKYVGSAIMGVYRDANGRPLTLPAPPLDYSIPPAKSDIHVLPIMELDETTIDGTAQILEEIVRQVDCELGELKDRYIDTVGDQMTNARVRSLQDLRQRDLPDHRMDFAGIKPGYLHIAMAMVDALFRCNMGKKEDPGSYSRFINILGRTRVGPDIPDFNSCHRFVDIVLSSYILAACIELANDSSPEPGRRIRSLQDLSAWIEKNDWLLLIYKVRDRFMPLQKVAVQKEAAARAAQTEYLVRRSSILNKAARTVTREEKALLSRAGRKEFIRTYTLKHRDVVYENALLLMQQSIIYREFYASMRGGHSERLSKDFEILPYFFAGCRKTNYAREMMEIQVDKIALWTDEHHYINLNNCLINLSGRPGKFIAVDECCELVNNAVTHGYNPRDSWQSRKFHREFVARNIIAFRNLRTSMHKSTGAPGFGSRHTRVDDKGDVERVIQHLLRDNVLRRSEGRTSIRHGRAMLPVQESIDTVDKGSTIILGGAILSQIIANRQQAQESLRIPDMIGEDPERDWVEQQLALFETMPLVN